MKGIYPYEQQQDPPACTDPESRNKGMDDYSYTVYPDAPIASGFVDLNKGDKLLAFESSDWDAVRQSDQSKTDLSPIQALDVSHLGLR